MFLRAALFRAAFLLVLFALGVATLTNTRYSTTFARQSYHYE